MQSTRPQSTFALAEDGEAIGTIDQFSRRLDLPASQVLPCLQKHAGQSVLLQAGGTSEQLLILDTEGVTALRGCAESGDAAN